MSDTISDTILNSMTWIDWTLIVILLLSCLKSLSKGFVHQFLSLIILLASFYIAIKYNTEITDFINNIIGDKYLDQSYTTTGIFIVLFVILSKLVNKIMRKINRDGIGIIDRILGVFYGFTRGMLIIVLLIGFNIFSYVVINNDWKNSKVVTMIQPITTIVFEIIPKNIQNSANSSLKAIDSSDNVQTIKRTLNKAFGWNLKTNKLSSTETKDSNKIFNTEQQKVKEIQNRIKQQFLKEEQNKENKPNQ